VSATARKQLPAPPLGVVASLTSGFETVSARLELILLPILLDLFLWLGPHVSVKPLTAQLYAFLASQAAAVPESTMVDQGLETWRQLLTFAGETVNLFASASIPLLGMPSLLSGLKVEVTPLGRAAVWPIDSWLVAFSLWGGLTLLGVWLGALYFGGIAQQVRDGRLSLGLLLRQIWGDWARLTALAALMLGVVVAIQVPMAMATVALSLLVNTTLGELVQFVSSTFILLAFIFGGFALHGIILQRRGLFGAVWDSLRLVFVSLPSTTALFAVVLMANTLLGYVWDLPPTDSWYLLIGVGGHALVYTALASATFVYYKDRYRWWVELQQMLRTRPPA
jgi:hypothetical protein